jgi:2-polyprenyl-3-methyl-5-hydroxy-6-metoxy-1,4-benzoquinol methylase
MDQEPINKQQEYQRQRIEHWNQIALQRSKWHSWGGRYHQRLEQIYRHHIPPAKRVLEIGCGSGDLLASLQPSFGLGVDFSPAMIQAAQSRHPQFNFQVLDAHAVDSLQEQFDFIILSDLVNDLWDVQQTLEAVRKLCHPGTRIIINVYSRMWQLPLVIAEKMRLATPNLSQNWLTSSDLRSLLSLSGFETINTRTEILFPLPIPLINDFFDRFLVKIWPFYLFGLTNVIVARPEAETPLTRPFPTVTVLVPARNEEGNIPSIFQRIPEMGGGTEILFVEGNSKDHTYEAIEKEIPLHPEKNVKLLKQPGKGKGDAVRTGFSAASGDILMILDADLTVPPEDLPRFYNAIAGRKGEFINGVRLIYPMEEEAMRFLNFLGNKFFSLAFTWLLGQSIKDTLCGTKVLWKVDYETIAANRSYFGDFDPFGDFDLLFGAARMNLKILDLPIRYRERTYGETNISRWSHGLLLLKMVLYAATKLKFK